MRRIKIGRFKTERATPRSHVPAKAGQKAAIGPEGATIEVSNNHKSAKRAGAAGDKLLNALSERTSPGTSGEIAAFSWGNRNTGRIRCLAS